MLSKSNCCSNSHCLSFRTYPVGSTVLEQNTTTRYTMPRSNIFPRPNCHFCSSNRRPHFPLDWWGNTDLPSNNSTRNTTPRLARLRLQSPPPPAARRRRARLRSRAPRAPAPRTRQPRPRTGSRLPRAPARRRAGQPSLLPSGVLSSCQVLPLAGRAPRCAIGSSFADARDSLALVTA